MSNGAVKPRMAGVSGTGAKAAQTKSTTAPTQGTEPLRTGMTSTSAPVK